MTAPEHPDVGAAALHALPAAEAAAFEQHLADCATCAAEYSEFLETAAMLAAAVAEQPPAVLRHRVLSAARDTPQFPPLVANESPAGRTERPEPARRANQRSSEAPWWRRRVTMVAAAAAIVIVAGGGVLLVSRDSGPSPEEAAARCVAAASDAATERPTVGTSGSVTVARSCDAAIVHVASMPPLASDQGYQLWVMAGDKARSVGMVTRTVVSAGELVVTGLRASDTAIGVSVEPAAGSPAPTSAPVWVVPISS